MFDRVKKFIIGRVKAAKDNVVATKSRIGSPKPVVLRNPLSPYLSQDYELNRAERVIKNRREALGFSGGRLF